MERAKNRKLSIVIPGKSDLSPGVQRELIAWAKRGIETASGAEAAKFHEAIVEAFETIFATRV